MAEWETPTLVIHGAKDFRLVESEGVLTCTHVMCEGLQGGGRARRRVEQPAAASTVRHERLEPYISEVNAVDQTGCSSCAWAGRSKSLTASTIECTQ